MTIGVLLMAHGTPASTGEIAPFYTRIRRGRPPTPEQLAELEGRYAAIGGVSPLALRTAAQVAAVRASLEARLQVLSAGLRTSDGRHQTLRSMAEWSVGLLDDAEAPVFRRLGIFSGGFSLEAAMAVAAEGEINRWAVADALARLVADEAEAVKPGACRSADVTGGRRDPVAGVRPADAVGRVDGSAVSTEPVVHQCIAGLEAVRL